MELDAGLVGHWRLAGDGRDSSGYGNHGEPWGVDFAAPGPDGRPRGAARFDGASSHIVVPHHKSLRLGGDDFTLTMWVQVPEAVRGALGDIAGGFDPATRTGFNFSLLHYTGAASNQSNSGHLHFGIDAGTDLSGHGARGAWLDCGRPGNAVMVKALCVYDGALYAGTYEAGADESGHVYRYAGGTEWIDCGRPDPSNCVAALAAYDRALYAGVSRYQASGSALQDSPNRHPGGRVYRYAGGTEWIDCGKLDPGDVLARAGAAARTSPRRSPVCDTVACLAVYGGHLYAIPLYSEGLFRYDGGTTWTSCGTPGRRLFSLGAHHGHLYGAGNEGGGVFRYEGGTEWSAAGFQEGVTQVYSLATYQGRLHAGTWPIGAVFRHDPTPDRADQWTHCGRLGDEAEVMGMAVYNGMLYAGTLPTATVYRYESSDGCRVWTPTGQLDRTPDVRYRRAWSMAIFQGRLFCGTLPSGHVYAFEAGQNVSYDYALVPGWRHLAAVRRGGHLVLYVDGRRVAQSTSHPSGPLDLASDRPLTIGFGQHDYLDGCLADVRLYRRALGDAEVARLTNMLRPSRSMSR